MDIENQIYVIKKGTVEIVPEEDLKTKLIKAEQKKQPLRIKLGLDPTAPDIHLGNAVVLRKMRQFQDLGHEVYIIIGDFTAAIGDPSGRTITRPHLTKEEIENNANTYYNQYCKILDPKKTKVLFNSNWLSDLSFYDIIEITSKITVAHILERNDFANRLQTGKPISMHELLYPVCQAYDSVKLKVDIEVGGIEQKFNIMLGRDLQRQYNQEEQIGLFMPILPGIDGIQKMSKSLGNYIGITETPSNIYGKLMSIPDKLIPIYYELCTNIVMNNAAEPMNDKKRLAYEIVSIYHSIEAAKIAQLEFENVFSNKEIPNNINKIIVSKNKIGIIELIIKCNFVNSNSEARRLIKQGAVSINGDKIIDITCVISPNNGDILRVGKLRYAELEVMV